MLMGSSCSQIFFFPGPVKAVAVVYCKWQLLIGVTSLWALILRLTLCADLGELLPLSASLSPSITGIVLVSTYLRGPWWLPRSPLLNRTSQVVSHSIPSLATGAIYSSGFSWGASFPSTSQSVKKKIAVLWFITFDARDEDRGSDFMWAWMETEAFIPSSSTLERDTGTRSTSCLCSIPFHCHSSCTSPIPPIIISL